MGEKKFDNRENLIIEIHNSITHGIGAVLGIVFLVMLILPQIRNHNLLGTVAYSIYGGCFILMFLMSTIYHAVQPPKIKAILRIFDHISIYYFIAGSFTPPILLLTSGNFRIIFLILIWLIAIFGTIFKIATYKNYDKLKSISTLIYVGMGWLGVLLIRPILRYASWKFLLLLVLGGLLYTIGTYFYKSKRFKYNHVIWHLFVLAAAIVHFNAFYFYLS